VVLLHSRGFVLQQKVKTRLVVSRRLCSMIDRKLVMHQLVLSEQLQVFVQLIPLAQELDPLLLQGHSCQRCSKPLLVLQVCMQRSDQVLK